MYEEIVNVRLQRKLKAWLHKHPKMEQDFRSLSYCGEKVLVGGDGSEPGVFVLSNGDDASLFGTTSCKSSWICPYCTAKRMAMFSIQIAMAIDALKVNHNQVAFMLTLTVPHTRGMTCEDTTEILYESWKDFMINAPSTDDNKWFGWSDRDPMAAFCIHFHCHHRVRVGEYTHGEHGWHPHFHCLFWVDADKFNEVADWEEKLKNHWINIVRRRTLCRWDWQKLKSFSLLPDNPSPRGQYRKVARLVKSKELADEVKVALDNNRTRLEIMYRNLNVESQALFISKQDDGSIIEQKSSPYVCGWGADKELTGNYKMKASAEGHETPWQILERAVNNNDEKAFNLFMEYAYATRQFRHSRISFSIHSGIKQIIDDWSKNHSSTYTYKKKSTTWKVVVWFQKEQWYNMLCTEEATGVGLIESILFLATLPEARQRIIDFLRPFGVSPCNRKHSCEEIVEKIYNGTDSA